MLSGSTAAAGAVAVGCGVLTTAGVERQLAVAVRMPMMLAVAISCFVMVSSLWS